MKFLLESERSEGAYNLIAPTPTSNAEFKGAIARALHRPFWFHVPKFLLRLPLGEMSVLITEGRYSQPRRLLEQGFEFKFPKIDEALADIYSKYIWRKMKRTILLLTILLAALLGAQDGQCTEQTAQEPPWKMQSLFA